MLEDIPIAILAGGLATRLRPLTETIPKSMVRVCGRPFIEHQIEYIRRQGLRRIVVCAGHLGEQIQHYFGDSLEYSFDGGTPLGTAGALQKALPLLGERFFVMYGDSYLPTNFSEVMHGFAASGARAQMTVFRHRERNVWFEDGHIRAYDKTKTAPEMQHIDYGLSLFRARAFDKVREGDLATVFNDLLAAGQLAGHEVSERFYEIGSPAGLAEFRHDFQ
ncbi:MAG TPA: sugar phosphate nucleotidyltransferase [Bryobacteraceae bacterium]|nr:sugar phosphate nucleotidyltransferase [Bryobacteraceae bacterium]